MRAEDWERAEELFHRLAPLEDDDRASALQEVLGTEPGLGREVADLLTSHDSVGVLDCLSAKLSPVPVATGDCPASMTGTRVRQYEIGALVGRGGMGDVYRARDTRLDREVALKFVPEWLGRDPAARDRFVVEARIVSAIDHANVCALHELGETDDGRLFLVMPFYDGETLKHRLRRGPLPTEAAVDIALQVAEGLAAAHERGIVHRDIKPANLLLTAGDRVKILDFGVAKLANVGLTRPGERPGTERYMAPEQAAGDEADERSDLWALGAVLFEMLTGRTPAKGPEPDWPRDVPRIRAVLERLLATSPDDRYANANTLIGELREAVSAGPGRRSHLVRGVVLGIALLAVAAAAWRFGLPGGPAGTDPIPGSSAEESVAVFPFQVSGDQRAVAAWGDGIVHLLYPDLEAIDGLQAVDAATVTRSWRSLEASGGGQPKKAEALELAGRLGAHYAVLGTAVGTGSALRLTAEVYDVVSGERRGSVTMDGAADSLSLADDLAQALLTRGLLPARSIPPGGLPGVITRSFPAFEAYMEGEREYRSGRFRSAAANFARAAEIDTTFARAVYRASVSYDYAWAPERFEYGKWAASMAGRLTSRDSTLMFGFPRDMSSAAIPSLQAYVSKYPEDPEGWIRLADAIYHLGRRSLIDPAEYRRAWATGLRLGGLYEEGRHHLLEDAFLRRDSAAVDTLLGLRVSAGAEQDPCMTTFRALFEVAWGDGEAQARASREIATLPDSLVACAYPAAAVSATATDRMTIGRQDPSEFYAYVRAFQLRMLRGEAERAKQMVEVAAVTPDLEDWSARSAVLMALLGYADPTAGDAGAAWLARLDPDDAAADISRLGPYLGPFWLGLRAVEERRFEEVPRAEERMRAAARRLRRIADDDEAVAAPYRLTPEQMMRFADDIDGLAGALAAYAAFRRFPDADPDTVEHSLAGALSTMIPPAYLRYAMGEELLRRQAPREAIRYLRSLYPYDQVLYVPAQFHLGRAYEALGDTVRAREHYRIFVEWWKDADPGLQSRVREARQALARLAPDAS